MYVLRCLPYERCCLFFSWVCMCNSAAFGVFFCVRCFNPFANPGVCPDISRLDEEAFEYLTRYCDWKTRNIIIMFQNVEKFQVFPSKEIYEINVNDEKHIWVKYVSWLVVFSVKVQGEPMHGIHDLVQWFENYFGTISWEKFV